MNARVFALDESRGQLSRSEAELLPKEIEFIATVTIPPAAPLEFYLTAPDACEAVVLALAIAFPDFDAKKPDRGVTVSVRSLKSAVRFAS